jgi:hypothetical protein
MESPKEELVTQIYYYCCSYPHDQMIILGAVIYLARNDVLTAVKNGLVL